jgi:hypothetical protein
VTPKTKTLYATVASHSHEQRRVATDIHFLGHVCRGIVFFLQKACNNRTLLHLSQIPPAMSNIWLDTVTMLVVTKGMGMLTLPWSSYSAKDRLSSLSIFEELSSQSMSTNKSMVEFYHSSSRRNQIRIDNSPHVGLIVAKRVRRDLFPKLGHSSVHEPVSGRHVIL